MNIEKAKEIIDRDYEGVLKASSLCLDTRGEAPFIRVRGFDDMNGITAGFTTRLGGASRGAFSSLNLGINTDDNERAVMENYRRIGVSMGIDHTRISCTHQVHKSNVLVVTEEDAGDGIARPRTHFEIDAQVTNVKNLPLIVYTADCVPIILADPVSRAIGVAHAGWRGTVAGIAAKTVEKMVSEYGCLPENIHAAIGPSIGPDNYEVDETVINEIYRCPYIDMSDANVSYLDMKKEEVDPSERPKEDVYVRCRAKSYTTHRGNPYILFRTVKIRDRYMLNLWNLNELILVNAGLKSQNIYNTKLCTMKNHDIFFSYRYDKGVTGRGAGIICLTS